MQKIKKIMKSDFFGIGNVAQIVPLIVILVAVVFVSVFFVAMPKVAVPVVESCDEKVLVQSGDTLSTILAAHNMSRADIYEIDQLLRKTADIKGLRADSDYLLIHKSTSDAPAEKIILVCGPWRRVELTKDGGTWAANTIEIEKEVQAVVKSGEIKDGDSFYLAGQRAGIPAGILIDVYDLLAFEIDFERDVRAGQKFTVFYQENHAQGERVGNGAVLSVYFNTLRGDMKMYRFKKTDGQYSYYDEAGFGAIKSLKRTPINNARVSSSFNLKRKHPVLGFTRAHKGVDFRAGAGTPIPASGAGTVVARSFNKGHGNFVKIRHSGSFETLYAHMSKFQKGVNVGTKVRQGQIIGYVGSTGLSTGPHLHYEVIKNGVHVNPMTIKLTETVPLPAASKPRFLEQKDKMDRAVEMLSANPNLFIAM
ncbi:hypothetical protein FACS18945_5600 [Bacteroidia bacterium]|nr:hypothetical protein FACS18945_5600 [Bacteroidia bacterium]